MEMEEQKPAVIVISGTNASGKSALGIELAKKYNGEIISADSRQIFRKFDLCCGKVTAEERAAVPHHMLDLCEIGTPFSVSDYQAKVYARIPEILARGNLPFVVGGTGLYIDAVTKGYRFEEETIDPDFRRGLEEKSVAQLQNMLSPEAARRLRENHSDYHNKRRLIRVIEKEKNGTDLSPDNARRFRVLQIGVTWPKEKLQKRIDDRLAIRLRQGMVDEVREYLAAGGDPEHLYSLGLEYKYIAWYLEGRYASVEEFSAELSRAIWQFARRQMKWFRRNPEIHWVDMEHEPFAQACRLIEPFLNEEKG